MKAGKLKEPGFTHWDSPNSGATNESGFTALPGGRRDQDGFNDFKDHGYYRNSTEGISRRLDHSGSQIFRFGYSNSGGISVRCVRD